MPSCACTEHSTLTEGKSFVIYKTSSKKHRQDVIKRMRDANVFPKYAKYLCTICADHYGDTLPPAEKKTKINASDSVVEDIRKGKFSKNDLCEIAKALGESVQSDVFNDSIAVSQMYKDVKYMKSFNVTDYFFNRNSIIAHFLMSAASVTASDSMKKFVVLVNAVDCLYKARNLALITPLAFSCNVLTYCLTGSKTACLLNQNISPAGGYTSVKTWMEDNSLASSMSLSTSCNDVITYFDNNQVIGRNWRVNYNYKCKSSVVTTVLHIIPDVSSNLQRQVHLSPFQWLYCNIDPSDTYNKINDFLKCQSKEFNMIRNEFLIKRIQQVFHEQFCQNGTLMDDIDLLSSSDQCSSSLKKDISNDPYNFVVHNHQQQPKVSLGEPLPMNPCSYESVEDVLSIIFEKMSSGSDRKWTILGCDGLPYNLGMRIIDKSPSLQNIILLPGLGHYEINMVRCVFKILWSVVIEDLVKMLGFNSPRALSCIQRCSDHHKAWQVFTILLFGTMDELMIPYVRQCHHLRTSPSLKSFYEFLSDAKDPNFTFLAEITFSFLLPLYFFRCGVRRNNHRYLLCGKSVFSDLFYITNMINYQEIEYRDIKTRVSAPSEIYNFIKQFESYSVSGHPSKGEGGDFILEAWNRKIKRMLPPGLPSVNDWIRVCKNIEHLDEVLLHISDFCTVHFESYMLHSLLIQMVVELETVSFF
ncbi:hypothetical protein FSP39_019148 [Pinctada imbricata]|uniref:Uncharacterized protein n=1 Tax=Pinctada imbricata TaxID=66713 RepID=A0AA89C211_PINIB|nr:hypothetical protein FSP39_019148 [Pinctada imbricata]